MFENVGRKIKKLAKFLCVFGIVVCFIGGIVILASSPDNDKGIYVVLSLVSMFICPFLSWIGFLILYGFGELVENTTRICKKLKKIKLF